MPHSPVSRREDLRLLTGAGRYVADRVAPGTLMAGFLRSPVARGRLRALDPAAALALPGAVAVLTAPDLKADGIGPIRPEPLPRDDGGPAQAVPMPLLAAERIGHIGEALALVVAESPAALADALEAIEVTIDEAPPLSGTAFVRHLGDGAAVEAALAGAAHRVDCAFAAPRLSAAPMEPRGAIATPRAGGLHYVVSTQSPFALRDAIAAHLGWEREALHVQAQDVGGSFGLKSAMTREDALLCWAARRLGRALAWLPTRSEALLADDQGRGTAGRVVLGLGADLSLAALKVEVTVDAGAYPSRRGMGIVNNANGFTGMYRVGAAFVAVTGEMSNRPPIAPFRGNGRPEASYAVERALDAAARQIGCDPVELRRRNLLAPDEMPAVTALGTALDCGDFPRVMDRALALSRGAGSRRRAAEARGLLFGQGLANCVESSAGPIRAPKPDRARLRVTPEGRISVAPGVMSVGQGHETTLSRLAAEALGVDPGRIDYVNGDTRAVTSGRGNGGSAGTGVAGAALRLALDRLLAEGRDRAALRLGVAPGALTYRDGAFFRADGNESVTLEALAGDEGWTVEEVFTPPAATFPNGTHLCEVEIDPATGHVAVTLYAAAEDVGTVLNPPLVEGQLHGGIAQGLSQALGERIVEDAGGQLLTGSFMDYRMIRAADLPGFRTATVEVPTAVNPLGVKGVGEAGTVGATAAVMSAIADALARAGAAPVDMPATPEAIWRALRAAGHPGAA